MKNFESYVNEIGFDMNEFIESTDYAKKVFDDMAKEKNASIETKAMAYHIGQLINFATMGTIETMKEENTDVKDISTLYLSIITAILNGPIAFQNLVISMVKSNHY